MSPKEEFKLLRLSDCAVSSRMGLVDKGFPDYMREIAAEGHAVAKDGGYVVTPAGIEYLRMHRQLLRRI